MTTPPAAGRGDTDSGGEVWRPVCGCEQGMGHMDRDCHSYGLCHAQSAERAAREAEDQEHSTDLTPGVVWTDAQLAVVRDLTARAVRAQAAVNRVEALAAEYAARAEKVADGFWKRHLWIVSQRLRRALDGTA